jgi:hypothetical protein
MTGDLCWLCARNKTRRWFCRHVPQMSGGLSGAGLAVTTLTWHAPGTAGDVSCVAGTVAVICGVTGMAAWLTGWRPSFRPRLPRFLRDLEWVLAAAAFLTASAALTALAVVDGWHV